MKHNALALCAALALAAGARLQGHHSYGGFELDRTVSIEGTIQNILYANPHVVLTVLTRDSVVYTGTWGPPLQLRRLGFDPMHLKVGDVVVISGNPARDAAVHELVRLSEVRRPRDGWLWKRQPLNQAAASRPHAR